MKLHKKQKQRIKTILTHVCLIFLCIILNFPVFWMISSSLKSHQESLKFPPDILPEKTAIENYNYIWTEMNFEKYFLNTAYVSVLAVLITMSVGTIAGYSFSRFRMKAKQQILIFILFFRMLPPVLFIIPLFFIIKNIGLFDRLEGVILSLTTIALPFAVWMMKNYIDTIPHEIDEAATIDGCSRFRAFYCIILPLIKPGLVATSVFCLLTSWNEFMFANILIHSESRRTLVVALYSYLGDFNIEWNKLMAASILTMIPVIVFFFLIQKKLTKGMVGATIKG